MYSFLIIKLRLVAQHNTVNVDLNLRVKTLFKFFLQLEFRLQIKYTWKRLNTLFFFALKQGSYVHARPLVFSPPAPQFHSVWSNQNAETYVQPPAVMSPVTQYVQVRLFMPLIFES